MSDAHHRAEVVELEIPKVELDAELEAVTEDRVAAGLDPGMLRRGVLGG